ncbi:MAG: hypothetical protein WD226_06975 [Planctomycetota bacterium]
MGSVTDIRQFATNGSGESLVEIDTNGSTASDELIFDGTVIVRREGQAMIDPPGTTAFRIVESMQLNDRGDVVLVQTIGGVPFDQNEILTINDVVALQEGGDASVAGFAGATWSNFQNVQISNPAGADDLRVLAYASVNTGGVLSDTLLMIVADSSGVVSSVTPVLSKGDVFDMSGDVGCPLASQTVFSIATGVNRFAVNNAGEWIAEARLTGSSSNDRCIIFNGAIIAREGCPSAAGSNWSDLSNVEVDINDNPDGTDWLVAGIVTGALATNHVVVRNDAVVVRKGDSLPGINGTISWFGSAPVKLTDAGGAIWYGQWADPDPTLGSAIFIDDAVSLQKGQTMIDGATVTSIDSSDNSWSTSPAGDRIIAELSLSDSRSGVWSIPVDTGIPDVITEGISCGNLATLTHVGGTAILGDGFTLRMDSGQADGVLPILFFANKWIGHPAPYDPTMDCGFPWTYGNLLLSVAAPNPVDFSPFVPPPVTLWASGMPVDFFVDLTIPQDPAGLVGRTFLWQGLFLDFSGVAPPSEKFRLTNVVTTTFGSN